MSKLLKTLFLMEDLCFGGTQKQNIALANGLDPARFSARILTLTGPTDLDNEVETHVPISYLGQGRDVNPFFFYKVGVAIRELSPDILIPCTALPNIWGRLWGKVLKIPIVLGTCRGGGAPARQHERLLWRLSNHIVCNSKALVKVMKNKGVPGDHLSYIPNGVDCVRFRPLEHTSSFPLMLCVARLSPDKDLPTLLEAFQILAERDPGVHLRIVGEGPEETKLKRIINSMSVDVQSRIELTGACADPAPHYKEADLFVLSSIREGQPNVIMEAMSSGLPICATAVGGIPDLIGQGEGGFLSPPKDALSLAQNMRKLIEDPDSRRKMGDWNRRKVENDFSFKKMISSYEDLLESLWSQVLL